MYSQQVNNIDKKIKELELLNKILLDKLSLRGGAPVTLCIRGREFQGLAEPVAEDINLMKYPTIGMIELLKLIHYNDKHPENKNIIMNKNNNNLLHIYHDDKWCDININDIIYPIMNKLFKMMDKYYIRNIKDLDEKIDIQNRFENLRHRIENKDKNCLKYFTSEISLLMYEKKLK